MKAHSTQWQGTPTEACPFAPTSWYPLAYNAPMVPTGWCSFSSCCSSLGCHEAQRLVPWTLGFMTPMENLGGVGAFISLHPVPRATRGFEELHVSTSVIALICHDRAQLSLCIVLLHRLPSIFLFTVDTGQLLSWGCASFVSASTVLQWAKKGHIPFLRNWLF